jgi:hypothetical protein
MSDREKEDDPTPAPPPPRAAPESSATTRADSTRKLSNGLILPEHCQDVTSEKLGTMYALVGPPLKRK